MRTSSAVSNFKKFAGIILLLILASLFIFLTQSWKSDEYKVPVRNTSNQSSQVNNWGIPFLHYIEHFDTIHENEFLADILLSHDVDYNTIHQLSTTPKEVFDVRTLRAGKSYRIIYEDSGCPADFMVYHPNPYEDIVFDLGERPAIKRIEKPVEICEESASGVIESSLWNCLKSRGYSAALIAQLEDAFAWSIDFHHIQVGDRFKVIYETKYVNDKYIGIGDIKAAYFENMDSGFYAYYFDSPNYSGFYDEKGRPMKKAFLKAPLQYSRISSRYNPRRFHPVLKRVRAHLGTDYAAPRGTPIRAVGNGVVIKASYTRGNGNYVKIKHDDVYQTQYLHMSRFAKGIRPGTHVRQGQTIGFVGSTGLATGPHVCFRFWKNGRQVDHLRLNFPPPEPMPREAIPAFKLQQRKLEALLESIDYPDPVELPHLPIVLDNIATLFPE